MKVLALAAAVLILAGCARQGLRGGGGATSGTASIGPGQKWTKSWPVEGNYVAKCSFSAVGGNVNAYLMTDAEWAKWQGGAAVETLDFLAQQKNADVGELSANVQAGTTMVLIFENPGTASVELKWWGSFQ